MTPCHFDEQREEKSYSTNNQDFSLTLEMTGLNVAELAKNTLLLIMVQ
jgi:hypothetical protein